MVLQACEDLKLHETFEIMPALHSVALCHRKIALPMVSVIALVRPREPERAAAQSVARVDRCPPAPKNLSVPGAAQLAFVATTPKAFNSIQRQT